MGSHLVLGLIFAVDEGNYGEVTEESDMVSEYLNIEVAQALMLPLKVVISWVIGFVVPVENDPVVFKPEGNYEGENLIQNPDFDFIFKERLISSVSVVLKAG